ncbi:MAG: aryldialkylphosphatase [Actinobacteria bacterium]|nr:aryldialkylphosphatase [Actinomycetota bacterium]
MSEGAVVQTVTGPVPADALGHVAFHEHLLCDLRPRDPAQIAAAGARLHQEITLETLYEIRRHDVNLHNLVLDSEEDALAELNAFRAAGGGTLVDLTLDCIGRRPDALRRLSEASGVRIVMGCGWYVHEFHGETPHVATPQQLGARIAADLLEGVGGVQAGVIGEIGLSWPVEPCESDVLEGAVQAQQATGACLVIHPGRHPRAAFDAVERVRAFGGDVERTVVSHVERTLFTADEIVQLASTGATLSFDLFGHEASYYPHAPIELPNDAGRLDLIRALLDAGFERQIVISQDVCSKVHTRRWGGEGYAHILDHVLPVMRARGFAEAEVHALTVRNPAGLLARRAPTAPAAQAQQRLAALPNE